MAAFIAEKLATAIVTGELAAGTPLRQDRIAADFSASHVPAREALQLLRAQGLAVSEPRRGMRVAPLDAPSMRETAEIRAALEATALRAAMPFMTATLLGKIEAALLAGDHATSFEEWELANRVFHRTLVSGCGMPRLLGMLDELQLANSRAIFAHNRTATWRPRSSQDHRQILTAVNQRETERAVQLLTRHIRGIEQAG